MTVPLYHKKELLTRNGKVCVSLVLKSNPQLHYFFFFFFFFLMFW